MCFNTNKKFQAFNESRFKCPVSYGFRKVTLHIPLKACLCVTYPKLGPVCCKDLTVFILCLVVDSIVNLCHANEIASSFTR